MKDDTALPNLQHCEMRNKSAAKENDKDPVCQLTEQYGKIHWNTVLIAGVHNKCCFKVSMFINGKKFSGAGTTLGIAKMLCASKALKEVSKENVICKNVSSGVSKRFYPIIEDIEEQSNTENKRHKNLQVMQNITNYEFNSKLNAAEKNHNLKMISDISKGKNLKTQYPFKTKTATDIRECSQDKEVMPPALPFTLEKIDDDCYVVNGDTNQVESNDSTKESEDDCVIIDQNDCLNISYSGSKLNVPESNSKIEICDVNNKMSLWDKGAFLRNNLKSFKSTTKNDLIGNSANVQTIEMKMCIKSYAKKPVGGTNLLSTAETNTTRTIKRHREENLQLNELPAAKIRATDKHNVLSKQRQWCQEKNVIRYLKQLQPKVKFTLESKIGNENEPYFLVSAMVSNRKFFGHGKTKYLAEMDATQKILNYLEKGSNQLITNYELPKQPNQLNDQQIVLNNGPKNEIYSSLLLPSNYADLIESKIMKAFKMLTYRHDDFNSYKVLAGIIMTFHMNFDKAMIVSIATGTKCINGGNICCNGSVLNDCHAEILAKRGLMKFLFKQLKKHCSCATMDDSVFEITPSGYKLKSYVHFHLYINTAPCGDARVFNFNHTYNCNTFETSFNSLQYGQLRTKIEGELGTTVTGSAFNAQTWDGVILGDPLHTMSCSDKIALWNVVGIQGALLSQFIEPIYLHSITLGSLFNAQHLYRAICGRIQETLGYLPYSYRLNRPVLGQTTKTVRRCIWEAPKIGINWTWGDNDIEVISLPTGRSIYNETSVLSKQAFFLEYCYLRNNLPNLGYIPFSKIYAEAKQNSQSYQIAKKKVYEAFYMANLGNWVKKPREQNQFAMNIN